MNRKANFSNIAIWLRVATQQSHPTNLLLIFPKLVDSTPSEIVCPACKGKKYRTSYGIVKDNLLICGKCNGTGTIPQNSIESGKGPV